MSRRIGVLEQWQMKDVYLHTAVFRHQADRGFLINCSCGLWCPKGWIARLELEGKYM